ncbi:MAG: HAD family hydrolase [Proteobacteria bacterium]|nr:HAD family hydrolase [Pseudomonadota bacterium]
MSGEIYRELMWLPRAPEDFRVRLKALADSADWGRDVRALANHALSGPQLGRLANAIAARREAGQPTTPLIPFKLGLAGNGTLDLLRTALTGTFARYGFALEVVASGYDQTIREALSPDGAINGARPDAVLVALDHRALPIRPAPGDRAGADASVEAGLGFLGQVRAGFSANAGAPVIMSTLPPPPESLAGSLDRALPGTLRNICERINLGLTDSLAGSTDLLLDTAAIAETIGLANWNDPTLWNIAKTQFSDAYVPLWADHVARIVAALRGKTRRALVLDLDNTLWGGVIGDDGLEGILIGQGDATGEAHLEVQRTALALRDRGVVLAVSSKNTDEIARRPFVEHPDMLLKLDHIAMFQANWNDKATNIATIASELSLGLESFVFLDDNPAERELVRRTLPEVAVPELPQDPALYARTLAAAGYFELIAFSSEDAGRADMYQMNARRAALKASVTDMGAYLASLDMEINFAPFDLPGRARIAQLISKSNQFNLTTRRYSEAEVAKMAEDPKAFTLQVRLSDTFGDNGMISVIICRETTDTEWEIDTWLMSCRVLGRGVERMVLREILAQARKAGIARIVGRYIPTAKNAMVSGHYAGLGFTRLGGEDGGETTWSLPTDATIEEAPMRITRSGFAEPVAAE